jgi:hypothetical protein
MLGNYPNVQLTKQLSIGLGLEMKEGSLAQKIHFGTFWRVLVIWCSRDQSDRPIDQIATSRCLNSE